MTKALTEKRIREIVQEEIAESRASDPLARKGMPWSVVEHEQLKREFFAFVTTAAKKHQRSVAAICYQLVNYVDEWIDELKGDREEEE